MNLQQLLNSPAGKVHRRLHNVWLHDVADRLRLRRKAIAQADGLETQDVETYPISGDVTIVQQGSSWAKQTLATMALLLAGAAVGVGVAALVNQRVSQPPALPPAQEYDVTFWSEDGAQIQVESVERDRSTSQRKPE